MGKKIIGVRKRGKKTFEIRYYDLNGFRQHETVKATTLEEAAKIRETRIGDLARGIAVTSRSNTVRFEELANDVCADYEVNENRTYDHIESRFRLHINPFFGHMKAAMITTATINKYVLRRKAEDAAVGTINRELEAIRRVFNLAINGKKLLSRPHIPKLRENNVRQGFFTAQEVDRLCRHLPAALAAMVRFAFMTGWRLSEIRNLEWRNVYFAEGEIRLDPGTTKNMEGRTFPMSDELEVLLNARKPKNSIARYVFTINGEQVGEFRKTWKTACHKAGLPCVYDEEGKPTRSLRLFHDLRRSAARELVRTHGLSEREAMFLTGHRTRSVFDRYSVVSQADLEGIRKKLNKSKRSKHRA